MRRLVLAGLVVVLATGCSDEALGLRDVAACPGELCTDDARERYDAVRAVDGVTGVAVVARSWGFDRGSSATAEVSARVKSRAAAVEVGTEVLRVLDDWPDFEAGTTLVTVTADPVRQVTGVAREKEVLDPAFYDPCSPRECAAAVDGLLARLRADFPAVQARGRMVGDRLVITGTAPREQAELGVMLVPPVLQTTGLRVAERVEVSLRWRGPLAVTLRLDGAMMCEQPQGTVVPCAENSVPLY